MCTTSCSMGGVSEAVKLNTKQCKYCYYWRNADGGACNLRFCNYLLWTGKRRQHEGLRCLSKKPMPKTEG